MKRIIIFAISVMIGIGVAVIAQAQNFYVGGGSSQWQVMKNDGLITNIDLWQTQYQIQSTILGFEDTSLAEVDSFLCSYVSQEIGNNNSMAYTATTNYTEYGAEINLSEFLVVFETNAGSSAFSATSGDATAFSNAFSDINIVIQP